MFIWCLFGAYLASSAAYLCLFDAYLASSAAFLTKYEEKCIFSKMGMSKKSRNVYFADIKAPAGAT